MSPFLEQMSEERYAIQWCRNIPPTVPRYVSSSVNCGVVSVILSLFTYVEIEFNFFAGRHFQNGFRKQFSNILIDVVRTPTNALFINLVKSFKLTLKYTIISFLHVSVFNDHNQGGLFVPN